MAMRSFSVPDVGTVHIYKRRGSRNIRLSVNSDGKIRVNLPIWLPYRAGIAFAQQKRQWLVSQQKQELLDGQNIGKSHTLQLISDSNASKINTRLTSCEARVYFPTYAHQELIQGAAQKVAKRALLNQAEELLPGRLQDLANLYGLEYGSLSCRHLKSRWGSCNSKQEITLNYYLMQLPWELIDYVLVHELAHTKEMNHSDSFWQLVDECLPEYKQLRKQLRGYQPSVLLPKSPPSMS